MYVCMDVILYDICVCMYVSMNVCMSCMCVCMLIYVCIHCICVYTLIIEVCMYGSAIAPHCGTASRTM